MDEILFQEFGNDEKIREEIQLLDEVIAKAKGNDWVYIIRFIMDMKTRY
ncbi:MAG: hypothetical protein Q4D51_03055 [Eubacteriales bacterium]|nr:hypothetical protein [Eubacteriales bacterium]